MKTFNIWLIVLVVSSVVMGQPPIQWKKRLAIPNNQNTAEISPLLHGGYIIGSTGNNGGNLVTRIDENGDTVWTQQLTVPRYGVAKLQGTTDGGWVLVGTTNPYQLAVVKFDSVGAVQWTYVDQDTNQTAGQAVQQTWDGGYVATGDIFYAGRPPYTNVYIVRLDANGQRLWTRAPGSPSDDDGGHDVVCTADHSNVVVGSVSAEDWHPCGYVIKVLDTSGNVWSYSQCDEDGYIKLYAACQRPDGVIIGAGLKYMWTGNHIEDVYVQRYGNSGGGGITYQTGGTGTDIAYGITKADGNRVIVVGKTMSSGTGNLDALAICLDENLNEVWRYTLDNGFRESASSITPTPDGGYLIAGNIESGSSTGADIWLVKFCSDGSEGGHLTELDSSGDTKAFRLVHESGSLGSIVFPDVTPGTTGSVSGAAVPNWQALPGGDGNNGDSLIFVAALPLTSDSVDTFRVIPPNPQCAMRWRVGCRTDSILLPWNGTIDSLTFAGSILNHSIVFAIHTAGEHNTVSYQILGRSNNSGYFAPIGSFAAANDSGSHNYHYEFSGPYYLYYSHFLLCAVDGYGCSHQYSDLMIWRGHGLPADEEHYAVAKAYAMSSYPNPFNPTTTLSFTLPKAGKTKIVIYDLAGREVRTLSDQIFEAGEHTLRFDGSGLPSGIYFARMQSGEFAATRKLLLLK